ncbi:Acyl-CoA thioesterase [Zostera marina]|uniref:Acyl-CoA thioesterase n=1 Tax=Zostera marina TaxID=29655 RepID=A0A0K9PSP4_ZOSMR|nr:Acyl-CoA thioesterase [Zostera marina]
MDHESVPRARTSLLQTLPSASLRKIAEVVEVKRYDPGEYVIQEGVIGGDVYFIYEGLVELSGSSDVDEGSQIGLQLKRYDYFGSGKADLAREVKIIALSKLTCLVLHNGKDHLLQPKSIWNAGEINNNFALVEHILHLESIEVDIFRGVTIPGSLGFRNVFGGQLIGQALAAASKTVDCLKLVHSLHAYFRVTGDIDSPIIYQIGRLRDGNNFATRQVDAIQKGVVIFTLIASFQKELVGFSHQEASMPQVPAPELLPSMEELQNRHPNAPPSVLKSGNRSSESKSDLWPIDIRFCESNIFRTTEPRLKYWFKARGVLSDDPALHRCVVAYASDLIMLNVSLNPHRDIRSNIRSLSLDHSIWFHREVKADDWLLYSIESPSASNGRGFVFGQMFNKKGELIASLAQEGAVRMMLKSPNKPIQSKI